MFSCSQILRYIREQFCNLVHPFGLWYILSPSHGPSVWCDRKQIAVPYRSCLGGGVRIVQIVNLLVFGKQIAVYDQKIAIHKHFRLLFSFPQRLSFSSAHEEPGVTRGQNKKIWWKVVLGKQSVVWEYCRWKEWTDGKEADEKMISGMVSPKTSHHLLLLWGEKSCGAGRPMGAQLAAWTCWLATTVEWARRQPQPQLRKYFIKMENLPAWKRFWKLSKATRSSDLTSPTLGCRGQSLM